MAIKINNQDLQARYINGNSIAKVMLNGGQIRPASTPSYTPESSANYRYKMDGQTTTTYYDRIPNYGVWRGAYTDGELINGFHDSQSQPVNQCTFTPLGTSNCAYFDGNAFCINPGDSWDWGYASFINLWIKWESLPNGYGFTLIGAYASGGTGMWITHDGSIIYAEAGRDSNRQHALIGSPILDGKWNMLTFKVVYDQGTNTYRGRFYWNAVLQKRFTVNYFTSQISEIVVGNSYKSGPGTYHGFNGWISDIVVDGSGNFWTDAQIQSYFDANKSRYGL